MIRVVAFEKSWGSTTPFKERIALLSYLPRCGPFAGGKRSLDSNVSVATARSGSATAQLTPAHPFLDGLSRAEP